MPTVRDILTTLDRTYPLARAEAWDKTGLLIGDATASVRRVLVAHEVTDAVLDAADGHEALVVYHPPLFRPLETLDFSRHTVRLAARCIRQNLHVIAAHTALDNAPPPGALGDRLAESLGLQNVEVLKAAGCEALFKIVVFTPPEALEAVSAALWEAGAGHIGNYDRASFRARGMGTFRPLPGADPYAGEVGRLEEADEWRLEVIVPAARREAAIRAMIAAHPYEEVAYDAYPLHNSIEPYGAARVGELPEKLALDEFARQVQTRLMAPNLRLVRAGRDSVRRIVCVPGSGASFIDAATRFGCDCLVTGDIKHHDALQAQAQGLAVIDTTHSATERAAVGMLAKALTGLSDIEVTRCELDPNPFAAL